MRIRIFALLLVMVVFNPAKAMGEECARIVLVEQVLLDPALYDSKKICIAGILNIEFEGDALIWGQSSVWLNFYHGPPWFNKEIDRDKRRMEDWKQKYQHTCVLINGTFDREDNLGRCCQLSGSIKNILSISPYSGQCPKPN
ncbi:MAG TPA: hypothetical protein VIU93_13965 [Gallionellaceae bacterium]